VEKPTIKLQSQRYNATLLVLANLLLVCYCTHLTPNSKYALQLGSNVVPTHHISSEDRHIKWHTFWCNLQ